MECDEQFDIFISLLILRGINKYYSEKIRIERR